MAGVNGKQKGNSFERKIANKLSDRFKEHTGLTQAFRRNPDSGSFFGASNQSRTETHNLDYAVFGDLICPKDFNFSVECKNYKTGPSFGSIVKGKITQWDEWLKQARQDAKNSTRDMMLIIKYNSVDEVVLLDFQPDGVAPFMTYGGAYVYTLQNILTLSDNHFFGKHT